MKSKIYLKRRSRTSWFCTSSAFKSLMIGAFILTSMCTTIQAQTFEFTKPTWFFGAAGGANFNYYRGTTQELNLDLTVPTAFRHGNGVGIYLAPLVEFHRPDSKLGVMLQVGYDNRNGKFEEVKTPCNCPADLSTNLSYITVEPSLRYAPFKSNFYLYGGPRLAFNVDKSFSYKQEANPAIPDQMSTPRVRSDLSSIHKTILSMQVGAGYDIPISSQHKQTQYVLSPFVSFQPYFGQNPRTIETWNVTTLRVGAALKFGRGHKAVTPTGVNLELLDPEVRFTINAPKNIPVERKVREIFPIRNYVFFDLGSSEIPDRYVLLQKNQVKDFKEDLLEVYKPKRLTGRSRREMVVYYNVLNILGDRMGKNPSTTVRLTGASMQGEKDGVAMAESIKRYLVDVFGISDSRITVEGRIKPRIASEVPGGTKELDLLREGDRRVSIWSTSPELLMEFQSGPDAPLKPVEIATVQEVPVDAYLTFNVAGSDAAYSSWSLEIKDDQGIVKKFGPYTREKVSMKGRDVLGIKPEGNYKVAMIGKTKSGKTVYKDTTVHMSLWVAPKDEEGMRFSVIFEFNESKAIAMYEKYLTDVVTPKIPKNGMVIIHGYTDVIGDPAHNLQLSEDRANEVFSIIKAALTKTARTDVTFQVHGFGEDENIVPFGNTYPEERFYNRTVIIDIIPHE